MRTLLALCVFFPALAALGGCGLAPSIHPLSDDETTLTLVNLDPLHPRSVVVQGGAYGEHQILEVASGDQSRTVDYPSFTVHLAAGCGARLRLIGSSGGRLVTSHDT